MESTPEFVFQQLDQVIDPELGVPITDLGLVYGVDLREGILTVLMTLTTQGCPMGDYISRRVNEVLSVLKGIREVRIDLTFDPPWSPERIRPETRAFLGRERYE